MEKVIISMIKCDMDLLIHSQTSMGQRLKLIRVYNDRIALLFDRHLGSAAADVPVKFQSDWKSLNPNLVASRSCGKTTHLVNRGPNAVIQTERSPTPKYAHAFQCVLLHFEAGPFYPGPLELFYWHLHGWRHQTHIGPKMWQLPSNHWLHKFTTS